MPLSLTRAPSWSWVVTNAFVTFATGAWWLFDLALSSAWSEKADFVRTYIKVMSARCELSSLDMTGEVEGGSLSVEGPLLDAVLHLRADIAASRKLTMNSIVFEEPIIGVWSDSLHLDNRNDPFSEKKDTLDEDRQVFCLPITRIDMKIDYDMMHDTEYSMVLLRLNKESNTYRRIGMILQGTRYEIGSDSSEYWATNPSPFDGVNAKEIITIV